MRKLFWMKLGFAGWIMSALPVLLLSQLPFHKDGILDFADAAPQVMTAGMARGGGR